MASGAHKPGRQAFLDACESIGAAASWWMGVGPGKEGGGGGEQTAHKQKGTRSSNRLCAAMRAMVVKYGTVIRRGPPAFGPPQAAERSGGVRTCVGTSSRCVLRSARAVRRVSRASATSISTPRATDRSALSASTERSGPGSAAGPAAPATEGLEVSSPSDCAPGQKPQHCRLPPPLEGDRRASTLLPAGVNLALLHC